MEQINYESLIDFVLGWTQMHSDYTPHLIFDNGGFHGLRCQFVLNHDYSSDFINQSKDLMTIVNHLNDCGLHFQSVYTGDDSITVNCWL